MNTPACLIEKGYCSRYNTAIDHWFDKCSPAPTHYFAITTEVEE
jgi:hypothetical protein